MALPSTGTITMNQVNVELKKAATAIISLNDTDVRKLGKKPSGTISMDDLRGKSNTEQVSNYLLFSTVYRGHRVQDTVTINVGKKIISGQLIVSVSWKLEETNLNMDNKWQGFINILNNKITGGTKTLTISNTSQISFSYNTGGGTYDYDIGDNVGAKRYDGILSVDIKFTGEWEA